MTPSNVPTQKSLDLLAVDHLSTCPRCQELCSPGATVCAECGTHLFVRNTTAPARDQLDAASEPGQKEHIMTDAQAGDRLLADSDRALRLVTRPANVVSLHGYSKKVRP